jgi:predicted phosphodiesterase
MRYALISDIHANLEALKAALEALSGENIDEYLCVGDIIGYGADPSECIKIIRSLAPAVFISGNHEWGVTGLLKPDYFSDYAREAIEWTKKVLTRDEIDYLKTSELVCEHDCFTLVHGGLVRPSKFPYILDSDDAYSTMKLMDKDMCFVGHTHMAEIYYSDKDGARRHMGTSIKLEKGKRYLVNVGSVGQPRDADSRASYAIFDSSTGSVEIKRVWYDFKVTQAKIIKAGLPETLAQRLSEGR